MTARRRFAALGAIALLGVRRRPGHARVRRARATRARGARRPRFDVRGPEPVKGLLRRRRSTTTPSTTCRSAGPSSAPCTAASSRQLHAAGARTIVYDVQFTEKTKLREDLALYNALGDAGGAILATSESDERPHERPRRRRQPAGDRRARRGIGPPQRHERRHRQLPALEVAGLDSIAVATTERLTGESPDPAVPRRQGAGSTTAARPAPVPTVSFSDVSPTGACRKARSAAGSSSSAAPRRRSATSTSTPSSGEEPHGRRRGPGQRDLDRSRRPAASLRLAAAALAILVLLAMVAPLARWRSRCSRLSSVTVLAGAAFLAGAQLAFESGIDPRRRVAAVGAVIGAFGAIGVKASSLPSAAPLPREPEQRAPGAAGARAYRRPGRRRAGDRPPPRRGGGVARRRDRVHIERMGRLCERLRASGMSVVRGRPAPPRERAAQRRQGGRPHEILLKPAKLDPVEWAKMKTHTTIGAEHPCPARVGARADGRPDRASHHERLDGSGHPDGLKGEGDPARGAHLRGMRRLRRCSAAAHTARRGRCPRRSMGCRACTAPSRCRRSSTRPSARHRPPRHCFGEKPRSGPTRPAARPPPRTPPRAPAAARCVADRHRPRSPRR